MTNHLTMARFNAWANKKLDSAVDQLDEETYRSAMGCLLYTSDAADE